MTQSSETEYDPWFFFTWMIPWSLRYTSIICCSLGFWRLGGLSSSSLFWT
jgi:hypothetical protein